MTFEEWWEEQWGKKTVLILWFIKVFKETYDAGFRNGQKDMRDQAVNYYGTWRDAPTPTGTDGLLKGLAALPLKGDDDG